MTQSLSCLSTYHYVRTLLSVLEKKEENVSSLLRDITLHTRDDSLCRARICRSFKGTQEWEFFWLRFWILYYFIVSYVKILRFCKKNFLIGPVLEEVRFFRVVLGLRGMKKIFLAGSKNIFKFFYLWTLFMS